MSAPPARPPGRLARWAHVLSFRTISGKLIIGLVVLFGLASAWSMLGDQAKTRSYLQRITVDCRGSGYAQEARSLLEQKPIPVVRHACLGCHVQ